MNKRSGRVLERLPYDVKAALEVVLGLVGARFISAREGQWLISETQWRFDTGVNADVATLPSAGLLCLREKVSMARGQKTFQDPSLRYAVLTHLKVLDSNMSLTDRASAEKNLVRLYRELGLNRKIPLSRVGHPSEFTGYRNVIHKITKPVLYARRHLAWYWIFGPKVCARVPHLPKLCKVANDRGRI